MLPQKLGALPLFALLCGAASALAAEPPLDVDPWDLVRVETPDYPGAIATSATGSTLLAPPAEGPWRPEPVPEPNEYDAWEAKDALGTEPYHAAGFDGSGVKIAVFDYLYFGATLQADELGAYETHDCMTTRSCELPLDPESPTFTWEVGSHGLACAETIRDLAPGAELHLVRVNGQTSLENAVDWAIRNQIDIVSMSLSFFAQSYGDGSGPISAAVERFADSGGLFVTSAGNYATEHTVDTFRDEDGDGWHEFPNGSEYLAVDMAAGDTRMYLTWDEFSTCGTTDLDVYVMDKSGAYVGRSEERQEAVSDTNRSCEPIERVVATAATSGWHWIRVRRAQGTALPNFTIYARNADLAAPIPQGSIVDPGSSPAAFTVGAVRANSTYLTNGPESFSSWGPNSRGLPKPDIAGPNGLTTSVYGVTGFYGTSAATPAVAAAVALLMSADPSLTPVEAGRRLRALAASDATVWEAPDDGLGAGRARLDPPESASGVGGGCGGRATLLPGLLGWLVLRARRLEARCEPRS